MRVTTNPANGPTAPTVQLPKAPPPPPGPEQPTDRPRWYRWRGWVIGLIALFVGIGLGAAASGSKTKTTTVTAPAQTVVNTVSGPTRTVAGPTKTVRAPAQTVTTTVTAPPQTVTVTAPSPPDQSTFVEQILTDKAPGATGSSIRSFLQNGYPGTTVQITGASCVEAGTTQHYQCTISYSVSGAPDPSQDGSYTLGATGSCNDAGSCQTSTAALGTASRQ